MHAVQALRRRPGAFLIDGVFFLRRPYYLRS
jgi:hypothetical protein